MQWRDTPDRFGLISRLLHWAVAFAILWQLAGMIFRITLGRHPLTAFFVGLHQPVGLIAFALILLRVIWYFYNRSRRPGAEPGLVGQAARLGHAGLYALMIVVPPMGLMRAWASPRGVSAFGFELKAAEGLSLGWLGAVHGPLAWALLLLIIGHVAMVLVHALIWRDGIAARMLGRLRV